MILAQVQDEVENNLDRVLLTRGERCRSVGDFTGETNEFRQAKSHETQVFSSELMRSHRLIDLGAEIACRRRTSEGLFRTNTPCVRRLLE